MDKSTLPREECLDTAKKLITGDRQDAYGPPSESFGDMDKVLNALGVGDGELTGTDVVIFNIVQKLRRLSVTPNHTDSWVDLAGYAALGFEITRTPTQLFSNDKE